MPFHADEVAASCMFDKHLSPVLGLIEGPISDQRLLRQPATTECVAGQCSNFNRWLDNTAIILLVAGCSRRWNRQWHPRHLGRSGWRPACVRGRVHRHGQARS
jgi:hypothetical protein